MPSFYRTKKWYRLRKLTLERDHYKCVYCGERAGTADHIMPRYKGGSDTLDNLVASCTRCNALVGGRAFPSLDAKKAWLTRMLKHTPPVYGKKLTGGKTRAKKTPTSSRRKIPSRKLT